MMEQQPGNGAGIKYISYLDNTGYGIAGKMLLLALSAAGIPVTWYPLERKQHHYQPVGSPSVESGYPQLDLLYKKDIAYDLTIIHAVPPLYAPIIDEEKSRGKKVFGHTVWETDRLPQSWVNMLNRLDGIIAATYWNKQIFESSGVVVPVMVLPHISQYQGKLPENSGNFLADIDPGTFLFYSIGDWNERKIMRKQVETYMKTFTREDDVCLVIKTSEKDYTAYRRSWRTCFRKRYQPLQPVVDQLRKKYRSSARLVILTSTLAENEIKQLHARGNCYLSLCRSEGWGMGAYEAAWYGKPVIMTGFGGQLDFLPAGLSYLVRHEMVNVGQQQGWPEYEQEQKWAEPDQHHASLLMKQVFTHRQEAMERGMKLRSFVQERFDARAIAGTFITMLSKNFAANPSNDETK